MKPLKQGQPLGYLKESLLREASKSDLRYLILSNRHVMRLAEWGYLTEEINGITLIYRITPKGIAYLQKLNESTHRREDMPADLETLCQKMESAVNEMERLKEIIRLAKINTDSPTWLYLKSVGVAADPKYLSRQDFLTAHRDYYVARIQYLEARKEFEALRCGKPAPAFFDSDIAEMRNQLDRVNEIIAKSKS